MPKIIGSSMLTTGREQLLQAMAERIDRSGCRFAYLVPTAQLQTEVMTKLFQYTAAQSGQAGLALPEPQIYLFDGLVNEILKDWWEYQPPIESYQQRIILKQVGEKLAGEGKLTLLKGMVEYDGFYTTLIQWLQEVKRTGVQPAEWAAFHQQAGQEKERQLGLIYEEYQNYLHSHELVDAEDNYELVIQGIKESSRQSKILSQLELVIVDGFYKLNQLQVRLIQSLIANGVEVWVNLIQDEARKQVFLSTEDTLEKLHKLSKGQEWEWTEEMVTSGESTVTSTISTSDGSTMSAAKPGQLFSATTHTGRSPVLRHLAANLFNLSVQLEEGNDRLQILHMADPYQEMEQTGRWIKQALLRDPELQADQIAVILRNVDQYHFYIDGAFQELGIPYQVSSGIKLSKTPIFKLILKLYHVFIEDWSRESFLAILKSPYLQIAPIHQIEEFEDLLLEAGVIRGQKQWLNRLQSYGISLKMELWWQLERLNLDKDWDLTKEEFFQDTFLLANLAQQVESLEDRENQKKVNRLIGKYTTLQHLREVLRPLFSHLNRLAKKQNLREHSQALVDFFSTYRLDQQVVQVPTDQHAILRRDLMSLDRLQTLLQEMIQFSEIITAQVAGAEVGQKIGYQELLTYLKEAADGVQIPEPQLEVAGVQILTPSQSRGRRFKLVFVGGLAEGQFPYYGQNDWLFKQEERQALKEQGLDFQQFYERMEEERLFFLEAVSTATNQLILTCPAWQADERVLTSSFIEEVQQLYTEGSIRQVDIQPTGISQIGTPAGSDLTEPELGAEAIQLRQTGPLTRRELDETYLQERWFQKNLAGEEVAAAQIGQDLQPLSAADRQRLEELYQRGEVVQYREGIEFSPYDGLLAKVEIQQQLAQKYHANRVYSITELNTYATCPFQFFGNRVLWLDQAEEPTLRLEPLDQGNLYHQILFRFFKDFPGWEGEPLEAGLNRIREIAQDEMTDYLPGESLPEDLWALYQEEILENMEWIMRHEYEEAAKQGYQMKPVHLEASFGQLKQSHQEADSLNLADPVTIRREITEDGTSSEVTVQFKGKIDRIDLSEDGQYLIIYDYKFGSRKGLADVQEGVDLQLPIYVKAAQLLCGEDKEILGAGYFSLVKGDRTSGIWRDTRKDLVPLGSRSRSFLDEEQWAELLAQVDEYVLDYIEGIRRGDFRVTPAKCPDYCKFKKICRYDQTRIRLKEQGTDGVGGGQHGI